MSLHFREGSSYDYFKYGGKTRVTEDTFFKTKGKYFYQKYAKNMHNELQAVTFLASNFAFGCKWVGNLSKSVTEDFEAYGESLFYRFEQDYIKYQDIDPVKEAMTGSYDSWYYLILLNHLSDGIVFGLYDKKYKDDILWEDLHKKLLTFSPFVIYCWDIDSDKRQHLLYTYRKAKSERV